MDKEVVSGQGATKERMAKEKIVLQQRERRLGGLVGQAVEQPLLLDKLKAQGYLGADYYDQQARYDSGYRLRELWYEWNTSASEQTTFPKGKTGMYRFETGEESEQAEDRYHAVMRALPVKYHETVKAVCIDDRIDAVCWIETEEKRFMVKCHKDMITDALDALYGAFERVK